MCRMGTVGFIDRQVVDSPTDSGWGSMDVSLPLVHAPHVRAHRYNTVGDGLSVVLCIDAGRACRDGQGT
jgi:hypothetical protein